MMFAHDKDKDYKMKVIAYLKQTCGWSAGVKEVLSRYNIPYETKLIEDADVYAEMVSKSNQPLSPCVEFDGEMLADVGGSEVETWLQQNGHWQGAME